jgi:hypothetical protein
MEKLLGPDLVFPRPSCIAFILKTANQPALDDADASLKLVSHIISKRREVKKEDITDLAIK